MGEISRRSLLISLPTAPVVTVITPIEAVTRWPLCRLCKHCVPPLNMDDKPQRWLLAACMRPLPDIFGGYFASVVPGMDSYDHPQGLQAAPQLCQTMRAGLCGLEGKLFEPRGAGSAP